MMKNPAAAATAATAIAGRHQRAPKTNDHDHVTVHMPDDVTIEIFAYLPVKTLLRFKTLSKYWFSIIESPSFISKHYHSPNNGARILGLSPDVTDAYISYSLNDVSHVLSHDPGKDFQPGKNFARNVQLMGPVDGIFCIQEHAIYDGKVALWNPATNQMKHLPCKYDHNRGKGTSMMAFGLNPVTNCHKVVWVQFEPFTLVHGWIHVLGGGGLVDRQERRHLQYFAPSEIYIYDNDINNYWRPKRSPFKEVDSGDLHICPQGRHMKGVYYWLAWESSSDKHTLLALDMATEVFRKVNVPCNNLDNLSSCHLQWFPDESSIALISIYGNGITDVWGMKEEGNWIMRSRISILERPSDEYMIILLGLCGDDEILMARKHSDYYSINELVSYKLDHVDCKDEMRRRTVDHVGFYRPGAFIYKESIAAIRTTPSILTAGSSHGF